MVEVIRDRRLKILVVDDDPQVREMIQSFLSFRGFHVKTAEDGNSGLAELAKNPYDMLITDIYMPRLSGLELLDRIYQRDSALMILAITGMPSKEVIDKVIQKGAQDCLIKPFSLSLLISTIEKCVRKSGLEKYLPESDSSTAHSVSSS